jgi:hypothetical protein
MIINTHFVVLVLVQERMRARQSAQVASTSRIRLKKCKVRAGLTNNDLRPTFGSCQKDAIA